MRIAVIVWFVSLSMVVHGQGNLIPNDDFETFSACESPFRIWRATPWITSGPICSPDYFNECVPTNSVGQFTWGVPENLKGHQNALSGAAYGGFFAYSFNSNSGREFVQVELTEPIVAGVRYEVVFHVSLADEYLYAVSTLGAHFSDTQIVRYEYSIADLGLVPQVNSAAGMVFDDKENWTEVRDTFDSRYGGERFITIGNFNLDTESGVVYVGNGNHNFNHAYYYIDDVSVIALDSIPSSLGEAEALEFNVFPNPATGMVQVQGQRLAGARLLDMAGRCLVAERIISTTHTMHLHGIPPGLYLIEVTDAVGIKAVQKLLKQ
jgi:hypothetical protein